MQSDDPAFLPVGTEVSAKFKGAFCEAKIKKVHKSLKVKVSMKEPPFNTLIVPGTDLPNAKFQLNEQTDLIDQQKIKRCMIVHIKDQSRYHVVFNDGDEKELRRSQLVLKGGKHFDVDGNLDSMPLTNPESFSTPVVRGAAKRGAQKIKAMNEASGSRSSGKVNAGEGEEGEEPEEDDEEEEKEQEEDSSKPREKRRAANAAVAAIGELNQAQGPDTQSDESAADSTEEKERMKERRKKREEEKAGPSSSVRNSPVDEPLESASNQIEPRDRSSPTSSQNGASSSKEDKNRLTKEQKLLKREEKKRKRELEKEQEREQKRLQKNERSLQKELDKERKKEEKLKEVARKQREDLFKPALDWAKAHGKMLRNRVLHRLPVNTYRLKNVLEMRKPAKTRKKVVPHFKARNRHHVLFGMWKRRAKRLKLSIVDERKLQWWKPTNDEFAKTIRAYKMLRKQNRFDIFERWLRGIERLQSAQIVVVHENHAKVRKLLSYLEQEWEKTAFAERFDITCDELSSTTFKNHFRDQVWYPAVLLPGVFTSPSGSRQRIIRHMGTSRRMKVWEDDLIPFHWIPSFNVTEGKEIIASRPEDVQYNFKLACRFAEKLKKKQVDLSFMRFRLKSARRTAVLNRNEVPERPIPVPAPVEQNDPESDYDSDAEIKNATDDVKNSFITGFLYYNDTIQSNSSLTIQGYDVDVYYFHGLILKMGGIKKFWNANQWTKIGKKLVPLAVNPEEELKKMFKRSMESFMTMNHKLNMAPNLTQAIGDRKTVRPGQYSEARRRKNAEESEAGSSSGSTKTSTETAARARKKRSHTEESGHEKTKKSKLRESTSGESRVTTAERDLGGPSTSSQAQPPLSGLLNSESDEEDVDDDAASSMFSADGSERKTPASSRGGYKKRGSAAQSRSRRSTSIRTDDAVAVAQPKKGRPRKNTFTTTANPPVTATKVEKKAEQGKWRDYMGANILTHILSGQKLAAYFGGKWWQASAAEDSVDASHDILEAMLVEQANYSPDRPLSKCGEELLTKIIRQQNVLAHYSGWNTRYDEYLVLEKLLVTMDEQAEARRRFRDLPRGNELYPETMAKVEFHFQHWKHPSLQDHSPNAMKKTFTKKEFYDMAVEALGFEPLARNAEAARESPPEKDDDSDKQSDATDGEFDEEQQPSSSTIVMKEASDEERDSEERRSTGAAEEREVKHEHNEYSPELGEEGRGFESESDEPIYPPGPSAEQIRAMEIPVLKTIPSLKSTISAESGGSGNSIPCLTPQNSTNSLGSPPTTRPTIVPQAAAAAANLLAYSGPLTLDEVQPALPPATATLARQERHDNDKETMKREEPEKEEANGEEGPTAKRMRRAGQLEQFADSLMPPLSNSSPITSGALTLDIPLQTESSGPIEPMSGSSKKKMRKKIATPVFQKPSPSIVTSGPLTLSPLGRPKKKPSAAEPPLFSTIVPETGKLEGEEDEAFSTKDDFEEDLPNAQTEEIVTGESSSGKESSNGSRVVTSGSTTPMTVDEKEDETLDGELDKSTDAQLTPRGSAKGKKKKMSRFGGSYPTKPIKSVRKKEENGEDRDADEPQQTQTTPTHSARTDSFQTQKNRMAKIMEIEGTHQNYDLLDLPDFEQLLASAPKADVNFLLEERTNELREIFAQCKADLSQLERRYRQQQNEARPKLIDSRFGSPCSSNANN